MKHLLDYTNEELNALAARVAAANDKWWRDLITGEPLERNLGEMGMLVVSELAEAMEGDRKNLMDDKLPHRPMREVELADALIRVLDTAGHLAPGVLYRYSEDPRGDMWEFSDNFAEALFELTDEVWNTYSHQDEAPDQYWSCLVYNIGDLAAKFNLDLMGAFEEKMTYNATRVDHTREARLTENGKKY